MKTVHEIIKESRDQSDWKDVMMFRNYAKGKHKIILTNKQKQVLRNLLSNQFCDNICHQIVAEASDRITFQRWSCEDATVKQWLENFFKLTNAEERQGSIHYDTLRDGNSAISLGWDASTGRVKVYREQWWNGTSGVYFVYDDADEILCVVREWKPDPEKAMIFRTIYFNDRIERYESEGGAEWTQRMAEGDEAWPQPWLKKDGSPIGVPLVHFKNAGRGESLYGLSELYGGVLGFQDQINDLQYVMSGAARFTGYQMYTAAGVKPKTATAADGTATTSPPFTPEPGVLFWSENAAARFGSLPAGDLSQLIAIYNQKLKSVSRMTRTPLHTITGGDWPSGEALLRAEQPAVGKASNQIKALSTAWILVAHRAIEITNAFSNFGLNESTDEALISAHFANPERRDAIAIADEVLKLKDILSRKESLTRLGYTEDKADQIIADKDAEETAKADAMAKAFNAGAGMQTP